MIGSGKEFIVFEISEEYDSMTAIVRWGEAVARKVTERFALLEKLVAENPGLEELVYDGGDVRLFEYEDLEGKVEGSCLDGSDIGWVALSDAPEIDDELRLSSVEFRISRWGYFYWVMTVKHDSLPHETRGLSIKHDANLFDFGES